MKCPYCDALRREVELTKRIWLDERTARLEAVAHIKDMLMGDGQAWKEVREFIERVDDAGEGPV